MKGGMGAWYWLFVLVVLAVFPLASAQNCCVDNNLGSCSEVVSESLCDQSGNVFHDRSCSEVSSCTIGCCCSDSGSVGGKTSPEFRVSCSDDQFTFVEAADTADCSVICQPEETFMISGVVRDQSGDLLSDALVEVIGADSTQTTSSGTYSIEVTAGVYQVRVSKDFCEAQTRSMNVDSAIFAFDFVLVCEDEDGGNDGIPDECDSGNANAINLFYADLVAGSNAVELRWAVNSTCDSSRAVYNIMRTRSGEGISGIGSTDLMEFFDPGVDPFILEPDSEYEYRIDALFPDNSIIESNVMIVVTGSEECIGKGEFPFCSGNTIYQCSSKNQMEIVQECSPHICAETFQGAVCRSQGPCEECNRLFGMFGHFDDLKVNYQLPSGFDVEVSCGDLINVYGVCYKDYSGTIVNPYKSCADVVACNVYSSQGTCSNDPCGSNMNCEWSPIYGQDQSDALGLGLCTSSGSDSCGDCNAIVGGCAEDKCTALGDCVYSRGNCKTREALTCNDYITQQDCTGGSPVGVDAGYSSGTRVRGTHEVAPSNDHAGLGKCYWFSGYCFKDSDGDKNINFPDDCVVDDPKCSSDFESPVTNFNIHPKGVIGLDNLIQYTTADNKYSGINIKTFYCVGSGCYPDVPADREGIELIVEGVGSETLRFYSEDGANNLELIKSLTFNYDTVAPVIGVTYNTELSGTLSILRTTITVSDDSGPMSCSWKLLKDNQTRGRGRDSGETFSPSFAGLQDGFYNFVVECEDLAGNVGNEEFEIRVLGDARLSDFNPEGTFRLSELDGVSLSVKTNSSAVCRLDPVEESLSAMTNTFDVSGGISHQEPMPEFVNESGSYGFNVACSLNTGDIVERNPGHVIKFAIDEIPPITETKFKRSEESSVFTLTFTCNDANSLLKDRSGSDVSFGCQEVFVCEGAGCAPQSTGKTTKKLLLESEGIHVVRFYSIDVGGNVAQIEEESFEVDKTPPEFKSLDIVVDPGYFDDAEDALVTSADNGSGDGKVSSDTVEVCIDNDLADQEDCISSCPGVGDHCVNTTGGFTFEFEVTEDDTQALNTLTFTASDEANNKDRIMRKIISDRSPPSKPTFTLEDEDE